MKRCRGGQRLFWVPAMVVGSLVFGLLEGCEGLGFQPEEIPPSRPRELRKPDWKTKDDMPAQSEGVAEAVLPAVTPEPEEAPPEGPFAIVLERYKVTQRASERQRAVEEVIPDMTAGDVTRCMDAIKSGKRVEAEVGIALVTGFYQPQEEWVKIEDAYKEFLKSVPELRFDPRYILEHAWALYKIGKLDKAIEKIESAEKYSGNLTAGQSTLDFDARLLELRAWCYEKMFRESVSKGDEDDVVARWRSQAVGAWEAYRDKLLPHAQEGKKYTEGVARAEDHISGFRSPGQ